MNVRLAEMKDVNVIAEVHVQSWKTTYKGIVSDSYLSSLRVEDRKEMWNRVLSTKNHPTVVIVIEEDGEVFGFAAVGKEGTGKFAGIDGELYAIYLFETHQRKGGGKQLVAKAARVLKKQGYQSMLVWVLEDNPYKRFYHEVLQGVYLESENIEIAGEEFQESAYAWCNLGQLISNCK
ncbi:GNAT family N-acetyltransferase [Alkalihalobacterium alkalinitrilicum]|uniref:GNAT family N-acetyltransferase n=1 Tax=Alkalihalobacterium alkalinitrilicum TaxID=427920 RepID=UPI000995D576|nr:GNAT family N-acetyltransferase [Alkalihalobacterium alkalinitrilicum]